MAQETATPTPAVTKPATGKKRDWAALGIRWNESIVHTDGKTNAHRAIVPDFVDVDKVIAWLGKDRVLAILRGSNSPRVAIQAINRTAAEKGHGFDWVMERFYEWAMRIRAGTVVSHAFPDNTKYFGDNETEYRAMYAAKLTELGVPGDKALEVAKTVQW